MGGLENGPPPPQTDNNSDAITLHACQRTVGQPPSSAHELRARTTDCAALRGALPTTPRELPPEIRTAGPGVEEESVM